MTTKESKCAGFVHVQYKVEESHVPMFQRMVPQLQEINRVIMVTGAFSLHI